MSCKTDSMYRELYKFLGSQEISDEATMREKLEEFQERYNASINAGSSGVFLEKDVVDEAYDLLERAEEADSIVEARKLARQAYKKSNECFDAIIFLAENAPNEFDALRIIDRGLKDEKKRLEQEGLYTKENIGQFYLMFESRPYIRGLFAKAHIQFALGRVHQTMETLREILYLNEADNLGARYMLLALCAFMEDEDGAKKLYSRYPEDNFFTQFSMFVLYYKLDSQNKADKHLSSALQCNHYILDYFKRDAKMLTALLQYYDGYAHGSREEIAIYVQDYGFMIKPMFDGIASYIREYQKREKNKH